MDKSYQAAVDALFSGTHQARGKDEIKRAAARRTKTVQDMRTYLDRIGLASLHQSPPQGTGSSSTTSTTIADSKPPFSKVIHITGTKGKGSTACICESILRRTYACRTGLFTSPHLVDIRERIRLDGKLVSKEVFGDAYWTVRRRLEAHGTSAEDAAGSSDDDGLPVLPGYFRMLTLVAMYIFTKVQPKLDVIVLEVGMGGRYDATNILDTIEGHRRSVCGVTLLDFDHTRILGSTLPEIAWEKGGIFAQKKDGHTVTPRPPADEEISSPNATGHASSKSCYCLDSNMDDVVSMFRNCARNEGAGASLKMVDAQGRRVRQLLAKARAVFGLAGEHQYGNAELALHLCEDAAANGSEGCGNRNRDDSDGKFIDALTQVTWPARCQTVEATDRITLRLDGSHTIQSMAATKQWFEQTVGKPVHGASHPNTSRAILIFNCSHERDPLELLQLLSSIGWQRVYFCPAKAHRPSPVTPPTAREILAKHGMTIDGSKITNDETPTNRWQHTLASLWNHIERPTADSDCAVVSDKNSKEIWQELQQETGARMEILVTGSLYLVGALLEEIQWHEASVDGYTLAS